MLWNRSLVMRDIETGSLWSHILGRCMKGEHEGAELPFIPGTVTTWSDWIAKYPQTSVLNLSRKTFDYQRFAFSEPSNYVIGIKVGQTVKAYTFAYLVENPIVQEQVAGTPIVVAFNPKTTRALVFEGSIDGESIRFEDGYLDGLLIDQKTKSRWDPWSGTAISGELAGRTMLSRYGIISFRKAWEMFYPDSSIVDLGPAETD